MMSLVVSEVTSVNSINSTLPFSDLHDMDPVVTGVGIIGQGGLRTIIGGSITQSIIQGGEV